MVIIEAKSAEGITGLSPGSVLTIGNFDGVHIGHQAILTAARKIADKGKNQLSLMTFYPHPVAVLYPERAPRVLAPQDFKKHLLSGFGIDFFIILKNNIEFLRLPPEDFVDRFLCGAIRPSIVVEGDDFNFGANRTGSIETLKTIGEQKGFDICVVDAKKITLTTGQAIRVSSTIIRYMLESGHVADAACSLGRPYKLVGKVVPGHGRGRQLGFPTLNMEKPSQVIPVEGVYAGFVKVAANMQELLSGKQHIPAVFSIGQARTFGDEHPLLIEAHLLTVDAEKIKGKWMSMDFIEHIRGQHRFASEQELINQITKDCRVAKEVLNKYKVSNA